MKVTIQRGDRLFNFTGTNGEVDVRIAAAPKLEEGNKGFRPMQLMLTSLGSCMAIDVLNILYKQRQFPDDFNVVVSGEREDAVPSLFRTIEILVSATGDLKVAKVAKAIRLSAETYCSAYKTLEPTATITCKYDVNGEAGEI